MKKIPVKLFSIILVLAIIISMVPLNIHMNVSALGIATQADASVLTDEILGDNITASNISFTGDAAQGATFSGAGCFDFSDGIILSTGNASLVFTSASTFLNTSFGNSGDTDLTQIYQDISGDSSGETNDAAVLQFTVTPTSKVLSFRYVFASEEYDQSVEYNDVFALYVGGQNIAKIPGTDTAVCISTTKETSNYIDNTSGTDLGFLGYTKTFSCEANVTPFEPVTIRLAIADVSDDGYDSAVFIKSDSINFVAADAPVLTPVGGDVIQGDNISITSNQNGSLYLVPKNTYVDKQALDAVTDKKVVSCIAGQPATISTTGLYGTYQIYGVNLDEDLSLPSNDINIYIPDTTAPVISSVSGNATEWTNTDVALTINATDSESGIKEYSFDGGSSWQDSASKTYSANMTIPANTLKVKDKDGNIAAWSSEISINKIDRQSPVISNVTVLPDDFTNQGVTVAVSASDGLSGIKEYSFDGGTTWQTASSKTYSNNTVISSGSIKVKDNAGNITSYNTGINIDKIDKNAPVIHEVTKSTDSWTDSFVTVNVDASDELSGIKEYSFDGGATWQTSSEKQYSSNTTISAGSIKVKDNVGNISTYDTDLSISNIDNTLPNIANIANINQYDALTWYNTDQTIDASFAFTPGCSEKLQYRINGGTWVDGSQVAIITDGIYAVGFRVIDELGRTSAEQIATVKLDKTAPTDAEISVETNKFTSFLNTITFGLFFKDSVDVNITANSDISGLANIEYQIVDSESAYNSEGTWVSGDSFTISPNFKGVVYAKITDNAGNETIINTNGMVVDNENPEITLPQNMQEWSTTDVTVPVTVSDNLAGVQTVQYTTNETVPQSGTISLVNGEGSATLSNNGSYVLTVTAEDYSGNSYSSNMNILVDKTTPFISVTGNPVSPVQSAVLNIAAGAGVSGYGVTVNGTPVVGNTYEVTANGTYHFEITNGAGVKAAQDVEVANIDRTKPVIAIDSGDYTNDSWSNQNVMLQISNTAANLGTTTLEYSLNGGTYVAFDGSLTVTADSVNNYSFRATSESGMVSDAASLIVKLDKTAPTNAEINVATNKFTSFLNTITFGLFFKDTVNVNITAEDSLSGIASIQYYKSENALSLSEVQDLVDWTDYSDSISITPTDAEKFVIYAKIIDEAGNETVVSSNGLVFDLQGPEISTNYTKDAESMVVTVTDAGSGVDTVTYTVDEGSEQTASLDSNGAFTIDNLAEGRYDVVVTAQDSLGNQRSLTVNVVSLYTVSFEFFNGGSILKTETVEYGENATEPNVPTRSGYLFKEWDQNFTNVTSDLNVTAVWDIAEVAVTPYTGIYDGEEHDVVTVSGTLPEDIITYSTDGTEYSVSCPKYSEVNTYPIYVKVERTDCSPWMSDLNNAVVNPKEITSDMIENIPSVEYGGEPIVPQPVVKYGVIDLTNDIDFTISYSKNDEVGIAVVTVSGKGNYSGSATKEFAIYAKNTGVSIKDNNTPPVIVDNLDALYQDSTIYTDEDRQIEQNGGTVKIELEVQVKSDLTEDKSKIDSIAKNQNIGLYLDLSLYKTVHTTGDDADRVTAIKHTNDLLTIVVPIPDNIKGKSGITMYRVHEGVASIIPNGQRNAIDGEYCVIDEDNITLYVNNFSTYAIGYDKEIVNTNSTDNTNNTGNADDQNPKTGDKDLTIPIASFILSGITILFIYKKRKSYNH